MKVLAFSDLHNDLDACAVIVAATDEADLVIGAGDFCQRHEGLHGVMQALAPVADKAIYVPGNAETVEELRAATTATVLHGEGADVRGLRIIGLGGAVPPLPPLPWASYDLTEEQAANLLAPFSKADVLITHSPPYGFADVLSAEVAQLLGLEFGTHMGSIAVRDWVARAKPAHVFCGHIHDGWGERAKAGATAMANLGPTVNWFEL